MKNLLIAALLAPSLAMSTNAVAAVDGQLATPVWAVPRQIPIDKQEMNLRSAGANLSGTLHYPDDGRNLAAFDR